MRWLVLCGFLALGMLLAGCGDSGSPTPTADASGGAAPPPPPGGPPAPPGSGDASAPPADGATTPGEPTEQSPDAPKRKGRRGAAAPADGYTPPPDAATGSPDGQPGNPEGTNPPGINPGNPEGANPDGSNPEQPPRPPKPKTIREQAVDALHAGDDEKGFRLLYTYFLTVPAGKDELVQKMGWLGGVRRPGFGPRIGIAVRYMDPPDDFVGSPQPIGSPELTAAMGGFRQESADHRVGGASERGHTQVGAGNMMMRKAKAASNQAARAKGGGDEQPFEYYTGDFGMRLLNALDSKIKAGDYGALYKDLAAGSARRRARRQDSGDPQSGVGQPAPPIGQEGQPTDAAPGDGTGQASPGQSAPDLGVAVIWLGKHDSKDELQKAILDANVDLVVIYDMVLAPSKVNNFVNNKTKIRIVRPGELDKPPVFTSAVLENRAVMQEREKETKSRKREKEGDAVDREVARTVEALDKLCKVGPLPALTSENVKGRIARLVAEKPADPLAAVVEARYYVAKGLMSEDEFKAVAKSLLSEEDFTHLVAVAPTAPSALAAGGSLRVGSVLDIVHGVNSLVNQKARGEK